MYNKPYAAVLDLRMGTSSITVNTPEHLYDYITQKDQKTTTSTLGFRVTAYILKDSQGNVTEKVVKPHGKVLAPHIPIILKKVLSCGTQNNEINQDALTFLKLRI
jgi:aromatic ring-opening dioxygenase LigB subunit